MVKNNVRYAQLSFYFLFRAQRRFKMRTRFSFHKFDIVTNIFPIYEEKSFSN